jgi:hypothetical protein
MCMSLFLRLSLPSLQHPSLCLSLFRSFLLLNVSEKAFPCACFLRRGRACHVALKRSRMESPSFDFPSLPFPHVLGKGRKAYRLRACWLRSVFLETGPLAETHISNDIVNGICQFWEEPHSMRGTLTMGRGELHVLVRVKSCRVGSAQGMPHLGRYWSTWPDATADRNCQR